MSPSAARGRRPAGGNGARAPAEGPGGSRADQPQANGVSARGTDESPPARERLLAAARDLVASRGYAQLQVRELAQVAETSRQTFYNHFADRRDCALEACDPELARIDLMLRDAEVRGREWAKPLLAAVERTLCDLEGSPDTPRARLLDAMQASLEERGYADTRVSHLTEAAHVSREDFYRHFEDKRECLAALCGQGLSRLEASLPKAGAGDPEQALRALAESIAGSPQLARIAVIELTRLGVEAPVDEKLACAHSFRDLLERILCQSPHLAASERYRALAVGALADTIERAVHSGELEGLAESLVEIYAALVAPLAELPDASNGKSNGRGARGSNGNARARDGNGQADKRKQAKATAGAR